MQVHNISISEQNCNDISKDLNTCGLHYPSATELRSREGEMPRPAKRVGRLWFSSTAPRLLLELDSSRIKRTTPHTRNKYEHLVRWELNSKCKLVIIEYPGPTPSNLDQWISRSKNYNCPSHIATYSPVHHKNKAFGRNLQTKQTLW